MKKQTKFTAEDLLKKINEHTILQISVPETAIHLINRFKKVWEHQAYHRGYDKGYQDGYDWAKDKW